VRRVQAAIGLDQNVQLKAGVIPARAYSRVAPVRLSESTPSSTCAMPRAANVGKACLQAGGPPPFPLPLPVLFAPSFPFPVVFVVPVGSTGVVSSGGVGSGASGPAWSGWP